MAARIWEVYTWARRRGGGGRYRRYASGLSRSRAESIAASLRARGARAIVRSGAEAAPAAGASSSPWVDRALADWDAGKPRNTIRTILARVDALARRGVWTVTQVRELRAILEELAGDLEEPGSPLVSLVPGLQNVRKPGDGSGPLLVKPGEAPRTGTNPATGKPWRTWQTIGPGGVQTWQAGATRAPRGAKARRAYALTLRRGAPPAERPAGQSTRGYVSGSFGPGADVDDIRAAGEAVVLLSRLLELYGD